MKTILLGWELGANLGHARPLAELGRRLVCDGHRVVIAARDLYAARIAFASDNIPLLQAPVWPPHRHFGSATGDASYIDVLAQIGFGDASKLAATVEAWLELLALVKPDAVVADHSPALLVAARIAAIPVVMVGTGFTMPPVDGDRLPPLRADRAAMIPEEKILEPVRALCIRHAVAPPASLIALFRTAGRVVFGCPELDPYTAFRREPVHLPPERLPGFAEPPIAPRLFAYLGPEIAGLDRLIQVLVDLNVPLETYLRGDLGALSRFLVLRGHHVHETPPVLADVLPGVSHVIAGAGAFTCHAALAAGRPLLALPQHDEAERNTLALDRLGLVRRLNVHGSEASIRDAIQTFIRDHRLLRNARNWAKTLEARTQPNGVDAFSAAVMQCLAQSSLADTASSG